MQIIKKEINSLSGILDSLDGLNKTDMSREIPKWTSISNCHGASPGMSLVFRGSTNFGPIIIMYNFV